MSNANLKSNKSRAPKVHATTKAERRHRRNARRRQREFAVFCVCGVGAFLLVTGLVIYVGNAETSGYQNLDYTQGQVYSAIEQ